MSWAALEWARKEKVGRSGRKFCLIMLANYADESGSCYPKVEVLAADMEAGVSTVHAYIADLEKSGHIRVLVRYGKRGSRRSNRYQLMLQGADTPDLDCDDWHYERPDVATRKARGGRKPPVSGGMDDRPDVSAEASETGRHEPPESGGINLQNPEATSSKELNHQEEPPEDQNPAAPPGRRPAPRVPVQGTIDGDGDPLAPRPPTDEERCFGIARGWVDYRASVNKPIGVANALHSVKSLVKNYVTTGYTDDEIKRALNGLGEGLPSKQQMQRALDTIRDRGKPGPNGRPVTRGAGARVNDHWENEDRNTTPAEPAKRAAAVQTTGARW